jgi:hypothetical protein
MPDPREANLNYGKLNSTNQTSGFSLPNFSMAEIHSFHYWIQISYSSIAIIKRVLEAVSLGLQAAIP